jgi:hypothetical protein
VHAPDAGWRRLALAVAGLVALAFFTLAFFIGVPARAAPPRTYQEAMDEWDFVDRLNAARSSVGLRGMAASPLWREHARDHSEWMAGRGAVFHDPGLGAEASWVSSCWSRIAENVGHGTSVQSLHDMLMASLGHRANILGDYDYVGVGVERGPDPSIWVTQRFMKLEPGCPGLAIEPRLERVATVTTDGALYVKDGLYARWQAYLAPGSAKATAVSGAGVAAVGACDALYVKEGAAPWVEHLPCGLTRDVALWGDRVAAVTADGALYVKDGLYAPWQAYLAPGSAKATAVSGARVAAVGACDALYVKDGPGAPWAEHLPCGLARDVAMLT